MKISFFIRHYICLPSGFRWVEIVRECVDLVTYFLFSLLWFSLGDAPPVFQILYLEVQALWSGVGYMSGFRVTREESLVSRRLPPQRGGETRRGYLVWWTCPARFGARVALVYVLSFVTDEAFGHYFTLLGPFFFPYFVIRYIFICLICWLNLGHLGVDYFPFRAEKPRPKGGSWLPHSSVTQSIGRVTT